MCNGQKYHVSCELVPKKDNRHRVTQAQKQEYYKQREPLLYGEANQTSWKLVFQRL